MKTVKFRDLPLENRVFDKEEKDDGNHIHQMTTEITSPSSAQWLENFDDQGESCIALHMWQLAVRTFPGNLPVLLCSNFMQFLCCFRGCELTSNL
jgi:hypothetical protein